MCTKLKRKKEGKEENQGINNLNPKCSFDNSPYCPG
jgi:hypothetical protein